jgi:hypothetical protein
MDKKKVRKLKIRLASLCARESNIKAAEMVRFAESLGRVRSERGKEPTYVSIYFPHHSPISIPGHARSLYRFTAGNILDALEQDLVALEEQQSIEVKGLK